MLKSLGIIAILVFATPAFAATCLPYEPAQVSITGKVTMAKGYGPPNFGEDPAHDQIEVYPLLSLDRPTCVSGGQDPMDENVAQIGAVQLVPKTPGQRFDSHLIGPHVAVSGTLFHRTSGGHTEVMLMYTNARKAP
jgi:hypothetical protein